jgi:hypothetical protein
LEITGQAGNTTIKCQAHAGYSFNSSANVSNTLSGAFGASGSASVGAGATAVTYSLSADGLSLTVDLVESPTLILSNTLEYIDTGAMIVIQSPIVSSNIWLQAHVVSTGGYLNWGTIGSGKTIGMQLVYIVGGAA